jgi:hypothetical protein
LALPGTIPWKEQSVGFKNSSDICIALSVFAYIRLIPLPASMNQHRMRRFEL